MKSQLQNYLDEHKFISVEQARKLGISRALLSYYAKNGRLQRIAQGMYARPEELVDDLFLIASRSGKIVFSHETALALHLLHNRIPEIPSVTMPTRTSVPHSIASSITVHHIKTECFEIGKTKIKTFMGNFIPCYDLERTICDMIRSYNRVNIETYSSALKNYANRPDSNFSKFFDYAKAMGLSPKNHKTMEILI